MSNDKTKPQRTFLYRGSLLILVITFCIGGCAGSRPDHLGNIPDQLIPCPSSPNCVNSYASDRHQIEPFKIKEGYDLSTLKKLIEGSPHANIVIDSPNYLYIEYKTPFFGFIDDAEFLYVIKHKKIHIRSASRLGYYDFGVNRKRIESLQTQYLEILSQHEAIQP